MRRNTPKRAKEMREYAVLSRAYLESYSSCARCGHRSQEVHHKAGRRGWRLLHMPWWLPVCRECHHKITTEPTWAEYEGWSLPRHSIGCQRCDGTGSIRIEGGMPDEVVYDECPACAA